MNSSLENNKIFLQVSLPNEADSKISIIYLDLDNNTVHHTPPAKNITIFNLTNFPKSWMFLKKGKKLEDSTTGSNNDLFFINITDIIRSVKAKEKNSNINSATHFTITSPRKDSYNMTTIFQIAEIMENFTLNKYHQDKLDEYLYPTQEIIQKKNANQLNSKNNQPSALPDSTSQNKVDSEMRTTYKQTQNASPAAHTNPQSKQRSTRK